MSQKHAKKASKLAPKIYTKLISWGFKGRSWGARQSTSKGPKFHDLPFKMLNFRASWGVQKGYSLGAPFSHILYKMLKNGARNQSIPFVFSECSNLGSPIELQIKRKKSHLGNSFDFQIEFKIDPHWFSQRILCHVTNFISNPYKKSLRWRNNN